MLNLVKSQPVIAGLLCGALSAALSFLSQFLSITPLLSFIFIVLSYFSLVPVAVAFFLGKRQVLIALTVLIGCNIAGFGVIPTVGSFIINVLPAMLLLSFATLRPKKHHFKPINRIGLAISNIVLIYAVIAVFAMIFIFDINSLSPLIDELDGKLDGQFYNVSRKVAQVLPGIITLSAIVNMIATVYVANRLAQYLKLPHRRFPLPDDYTIPAYWDIVFVGGLLLQLTHIESVAFIGKNLSLIACLPLYLLGLSTAYLWLNTQENGRLWLGLLIMLSVLLVWPGLLVVFLGLIEPTLFLQRRFSQKED